MKSTELIEKRDKAVEKMNKIGNTLYKQELQLSKIVEKINNKGWRI